MKRKLLSVFLSLAMVLTMMPVFAMADSGDAILPEGGAAAGGEPSSVEGVAKIGDATYATLVEAIANAKTGDTIAMINDTDITKTGINISENKDITLDLNGKEIKASNSQPGNIIVKGKLTLKDSTDTKKDGSGSGKITTSSEYVYGSVDKVLISAFDGEFVMESGLIDAATGISDNANKGQFAVGVENNSKDANVIINGGKIKAGWYAIAGNGTYAKYNGNITINGGVIESTTDYAIYHPQNGTTIVNNGVVYGQAGGIAINRGTLVVNGGMITSKGIGNTGSWGDGTGNLNNAAIHANGKYNDVSVEINNGKITAEGNALTIDKGDKHDVAVSVKGGTFSSDVKEYCAENYVTEKNDDNTYTVKSLKDVAVAQIGENAFYRTIQDAVNAAENGATITLLKDTTTDMISIENGKSITLNTNGKTITNSKGSYAINNKGTLTINGGGKIVRKDAGNSAIRTIGTLNLENITVETSNNKIAVKVDENGISNPHGILNVGEGTVLTAKGGQAIQAWGDVTINGGTMNGEVAAWSVKDWNPGNITINNATINGDVTAYQRLKDGKYPDKPATINIINGMIDGASQIKYVEYTNDTIIERNKTNDEVTGSIIISGGYFNSDPTDYLATSTDENKKYVAKASDKPSYAYKVDLIDVEDVPVVPAVGETKAPDKEALSKNTEIDSDKVDDVVTAAKNVEADKINVAAAEVANKISDADAANYI